MKRLILALGLLVLVAQPAQAAITASSGSAVSIDTSTASATKTVVIPSDVPAGATIFVGIYNRTNNTATLVGVSDPVNGAWTLTNRVSGPSDLGSTRSWFVARENSAALSGAGNRTLTVETSVGVSTQLVAGWIDLDASTSALTFEAFGTVASSGTNTTDVDSNTVADSDAGAVVGFVITANAQATSWTADGAGESRISDLIAGGRAGLFFKSYAAGGGPYGFTTTPGSTTQYSFHIVAYSEPGGPASPDTKKGLLLFVGESR